MWSNGGRDRRRQPRRHLVRSAPRRARRCCRTRRARCRRRRRPAGRGTAARTRSSPSRTASVPTENTSVTTLMSPRWSNTARMSSKKFVGRRVAGDAEQLRQLAGGDRETDTDLDAGQRGLGDVVDERPEPQQPGDDQDHADEQRQRREVARRVVPSAATPAAMQRRAGEHGDRRGRADRQRAGTAEQRVHDHRHHARVEPDLGRKVGDRRVGHRLRDDDGAGGESADEVLATARRGRSRAATAGSIEWWDTRRTGSRIDRRSANTLVQSSLHADDGPVVIAARVAAPLRLLRCSRTRAPRRRAGAAAAAPGRRRPANRSIGMSPFELPPAMSGRRPIRLQIRTGLTGPSSKTSGSAV